MNTIIFPCRNQEVLIKHKENPRAKRLSLRVTSQENAFVLTVPPRATASHIQSFLTDCTPWIEKNLKKMFHVKHIMPGEEIVLHGLSFQCVLDPLRRTPVLCPTTQTLFLPSRYPQKSLYDILKKMAIEKLTPYVLEICRNLGQHIEKVTFRDTKSRWGSCSAHSRISLNWRLILAPPDVAYYVCVHEAVHLIHMNHSKAFWETVEDLCPSYRSHKKWLKTYGLSLMRI